MLYIADIESIIEFYQRQYTRYIVFCLFKHRKICAFLPFSSFSVQCQLKPPFFYFPCICSVSMICIELIYMDFTPQQLSGGPRFGSTTKLGNWAEGFVFFVFVLLVLSFFCNFLFYLLSFLSFLTF